jgi:hypothetical protein
VSQLTATTYHGLVGAARLLQTQPTPTTTGSAGETSPGPMIDQFFASNTWLTSLMAGVGVLLVAYLIIKAIFQSSNDGNRKATGSALRGALLALLLFVPSLIGKIADLGFMAITSLADWLFNLVH